jgi:Na+-transporting methylmalonyl-CoA/oxaloacetate decarboxylase gamma subunit
VAVNLRLPVRRREVMSGLQDTFYIMAIVFMSLMFLMMIVLLVSVFIIRSKIVKIHNVIENRLENLTHLAEKGGELSALAGSAVFKSAKRAIKKAKK